MSNWFFRGVAVVTLFLAMVVSGCDPSGGPTSALDDGSDSELAVSELAFGKRPTASTNLKGDLIAGQTMVVGYVEVTNPQTDFIQVSYQITNSAWCITETNVYVGPEKEQPPKAAPGEFPYGDDDLACVQSTAVLIDLSLADFDFDGFPVVVAAHAVVETAGTTGVDLEALMQSWTNPVGVNVVQPSADLSSFFDVTVSDWGVLSDVYPGWCLTAQIFITPGEQYTAMAYSSYDPAVPGLGLVDIPENLDLVNYIMNQGYVGQASSSGGNFTYGDVQRAIWELVDNNPASNSALGDWSQDRVDEITLDALTNGEGFVPTCGQQYGVILQPFAADGTPKQIIIIPLPIPCDRQDETAWAFGSRTGDNTTPKNFKLRGKQIGWGWWFNWEP